MPEKFDDASKAADASDCEQSDALIASLPDLGYQPLLADVPRTAAFPMPALTLLDRSSSTASNDQDFAGTEEIFPTQVPVLSSSDNADESELVRQANSELASLQIKEWQERLSKEGVYKKESAEWREKYNKTTSALLEEVSGLKPAELLSLHEFRDSTVCNEGELPDEQSRNAFYIRQYLSAQSSTLRSQALAGLSAEVLQNQNGYASKVFKLLSLTDAALRLQEAKSEESIRRALVDVALHETAEAKQSSLQVQSRFVEKGFAQDGQLTAEEQATRAKDRSAILDMAKKDATRIRQENLSALDEALKSSMNTTDKALRDKLVTRVETLLAEAQKGLSQEKLYELTEKLDRVKAYGLIREMKETADANVAVDALKRLVKSCSQGNSAAAGCLEQLKGKSLDDAVAALSSSDKSTREKCLRELKDKLEPQIQLYAPKESHSAVERFVPDSAGTKSARSAHFDLPSIKGNLTSDAIRNLRDKIGSLTKEEKTDLIKFAISQVTNNTTIPAERRDAELKQRVLAAQLLTALSAHISETDVVCIAQFGEVTDFIGTPHKLSFAKGTRELRKQGFDEQQAFEIQAALGRVLLSAWVKSEVGATREAAFEAFSSLRWSGVLPQDVRAAASELARSRRYISSETIDKVNKLVYDSGLKVPAESVLRVLLPGQREHHYMELADLIYRRYGGDTKIGDSFIKTCASRMVRWNALDSWARRSLTGVDSELKPGTSKDLSHLQLDERLLLALPKPVLSEILGKNNAEEEITAADIKQGAQSISAESFNLLTPELRRQLTGHAESVNPIQLVGVMVNGTVKQKFPFLADGFGGSCLERVTSDKETAEKLKLVAINAEGTKLKGERDAELKKLCELTKEGPGIRRLVEHFALQSSVAFLQPESRLDKWEQEQSIRSRILRNLDDRILQNQKDLAAQAQVTAPLTASCLAGKYQESVNEGSLDVADLTALKMLKELGPDLMKSQARDIYESLTKPLGAGLAGRSGLQRLRDNNLGELTAFPDYAIDPVKRYQQGLANLTTWKPKTSGDDVVAYRDAALRSVDGHPALNTFADPLRVLGVHMNSLVEQFKAAREGTKYQDFIDQCRDRASEIAKALEQVTPNQIKACRERLAEMRRHSEVISDPLAKSALYEKITSMTKALEVLDPASEKRQKLDELLKLIKSRDFSADTLANWIKENGIVILATIAAAAITVASMGTAAPLATILVTSAVCVGASQVSKEVLYQINHKIGDTGLGRYSERSHLGQWMANQELKMQLLAGKFNSLSPQQQLTEFSKLMNESVESLATEVAVPLGKEYLMNVALGFVCFGMGQLGAQGFKSLGNMKTILVSKPTQTMSQELERAVAAAARTPHGKEFFGKWMNRFSSEMRNNISFTAKLEGTSHITEATFHNCVGKGNNALSFVASACIALAQGRAHRSSLRAGKGNEVVVDAAFEALLLHQLKVDGHRIKEVRAGLHAVQPYTAKPGDAPIMVRRVPQEELGQGTSGKKGLPHEIPFRDLPVPAAKALGADGPWMTSSVREMNAGNYRAAYEVARSCENAPTNLHFKGQEINIRAKDILDGKVSTHIEHMQQLFLAEQVEPGKFVVSEPRTLVILESGKVVDILKPTTTIEGTKLAPAELAEIAKVAESDAGKRILAEHSFGMFEEMFHIRQMSSFAIISSLYREYVQRKGDDLVEGSRTKYRAIESLEKELVAALYEAGMHPEVIRRHFEGAYHGRKYVMDYVRIKAGQTPVARRVTTTGEGTGLQDRIGGAVRRKTVTREDLLTNFDEIANDHVGLKDARDCFQKRLDTGSISLTDAEALLRLPKKDIETVILYENFSSDNFALLLKQPPATIAQILSMGGETTISRTILPSVERGLLVPDVLATWSTLSPASRKATLAFLSKVVSDSSKAFGPEALKRYMDAAPQLHALIDSYVDGATFSKAELNLILKSDSASLLFGHANQVVTREQLLRIAAIENPAVRSDLINIVRFVKNSEYGKYLFEDASGPGISRRTLPPETLSKLSMAIDRRLITSEVQMQRLLDVPPSFRDGIMQSLAKAVTQKNASFDIVAELARVDRILDYRKHALVTEECLEHLSTAHPQDALILPLLEHKLQLKAKATQDGKPNADFASELTPSSVETLLKLRKEAGVSAQTMESYIRALTLKQLTAAQLDKMVKQERSVRERAEELMIGDPERFAVLLRGDKFAQMSLQPELRVVLDEIFKSYKDVYKLSDAAVPVSHIAKEVRQFLKLMEAREFLKAYKFLEAKTVDYRSDRQDIYRGERTQPEVTKVESVIPLAQLGSKLALTDLRREMATAKAEQEYLSDDKAKREAVPKILLIEPIIELSGNRFIRLTDSNVIRIGKGPWEAATPAEKALIESIQQSVHGKAILSELAMIMMEEYAHTPQGDSKLGSKFAEKFLESGLNAIEERSKGNADTKIHPLELLRRYHQENSFGEEDFESRYAHALREIDIVALQLEAGLSLHSVMELFGQQHLRGTREFFYQYMKE